MWLSFSNLQNIFSVAKDSVDALREENAALKAELHATKSELTSTKVNLDWLRMQFNQVSMERTALLDKVYQIKVPTPQLAPAPTHGPYVAANGTNPAVMNHALDHLFSKGIDQMALFDDVGDEMARELGLDA